MSSLRSFITAYSFSAEEMSQTVVIVGAGVFGISAANRLSKYKNIKVKLVTLSDNAYFLPSAVRVAVYNDFKGSLVPLKEIVNDNVEIVKKEIINIDENEVEFIDEKLQYDALIIATGGKWSEPIGSTAEFRDNHAEYFAKRHEEIKQANSIVLIGGGFNNVELAGELWEKYEKEIKSGKKEVTIIQNRDLLLPDGGLYTDKLRTQVTNFFKQKTKIQIISGRTATVDSQDPTRVLIGKDQEPLHADLVFQNVGVVPATPKSSIGDFTDARGFIKVKNTHQSEGHSNIFAIGDVSNFRRQGLYGRGDVLSAAVHNVHAVLTGSKDLKTSKPHTGVAPAAFISLGKRHGAGQAELPVFGVVTFPNWVIVLLKSKSLSAPFAGYILGKS